MRTQEDCKDCQGRRVEPFLRWAGGKRWLSRILEGLVPDDYRTYHEPFLGSGAIFFALRPPRAELSDSNDNLINAFETVRDCPEALIKRLGRFDYTREEYYRVRSGNPRTPLARTARFVYLNRTCWNGLYRVDRSGSFNVPYGRRGTFHESDADRIRVASATLRNSRLRHEDFEVALRRVRAGDFVFIDPPYTVTHGDNGFLLYNEKIFSWADQERLAEAIRRIDRKGALFLLTNANHPSVIALYEGFTARPIQRSSILAADPDNRRPVTELLVTNYRVGMREWSLQLAS